jgi:hypothetical protein
MTADLIPLPSSDGFGEGAVDNVLVGVIHVRG